jgi:hypothetical protein
VDDHRRGICTINFDSQLALILTTLYRPFEALYASTIYFHFLYTSCTEFTLTFSLLPFFCTGNETLFLSNYLFLKERIDLFGTLYTSALAFLSLGSLYTEYTSTLKQNGTDSLINL